MNIYQLTQEAFAEEIMKWIKRNIPGTETNLCPVEKLQGESYLGICVRPEGINTGPCINSDLYYSRYLDKGLPDISDEIKNDLLKQVYYALDHMPAIDPELLTDYASVRGKLALQLVNYEMNKAFLSTVPHQRILDLASVYRIIWSRSDKESGSTLMTCGLMESLKTDADTLHRDALLSAPLNLPPCFTCLKELLAIPGDLPDELWAAYAGPGPYGACVILYPGFLKECSERLGGDYYVIPSSVSEVLMIRTDAVEGPGTLTGIIRSVNDSIVAPGERLSYHVYRYVRLLDKLLIAD